MTRFRYAFSFSLAVLLLTASALFVFARISDGAAVQRAASAAPAKETPTVADAEAPAVGGRAVVADLVDDEGVRGIDDVGGAANDAGRGRGGSFGGPVRPLQRLRSGSGRDAHDHADNERAKAAGSDHGRPC